MSALSPALDLTSCVSTLNWADRCFESLNRDITQWTEGKLPEGKPYSSVHKASPDGITHKLFICINKQPGLNDWSHAFADCVHNLRITLDHFAFAVVKIHANGRVFDEKAVAFPIRDTRAGFDGAIARDRLPHCSSIHNYFEAVQPYNRLELDGARPLALLRDLDDINKHRLIQFTAVQIDGGMISHIHCGDLPPSPADIKIIRIVEQESRVAFGRPMVDGDEFMTFTTDHPCHDLKFHHDFACDVFIQDPLVAIPNGWRLAQLYAVFRTEVREVISELIKEAFPANSSVIIP